MLILVILKLRCLGHWLVWFWRSCDGRFVILYAGASWSRVTDLGKPVLKNALPFQLKRRASERQRNLFFLLKNITTKLFGPKQFFVFCFCFFSDFFVTDMATLYPTTTKIKKKKKRVGMPLYKWYRWCLLKSLQCNTQSRNVNLN